MRKRSFYRPCLFERVTTGKQICIRMSVLVYPRHLKKDTASSNQCVFENEMFPLTLPELQKGVKYAHARKLFSGLPVLWYAWETNLQRA